MFVAARAASKALEMRFREWAKGAGGSGSSTAPFGKPRRRPQKQRADAAAESLAGREAIQARADSLFGQNTHQRSRMVTETYDRYLSSMTAALSEHDQKAVLLVISDALDPTNEGSHSR